MTQHELIDMEPLVSEADIMIEIRTLDRQREEEVSFGVRGLMSQYRMGDVVSEDRLN